MGWRESYVALVELFPQVDTRLIKGAALEHGNDITSAVEFIINEVLGPDWNLGEQQGDTLHSASSNPPERLEESSKGVQEYPIAVSITLADSRDDLSEKHDSKGPAYDASECGTDDMGSTSSHIKRDQHGVMSFSSPSSEDFESRLGLGCRNQEQSQGVSCKERVGLCDDRRGIKESTEGVEREATGMSGPRMVNEGFAAISDVVSRGVFHEEKIEVEVVSEQPFLDCDSLDFDPSTSAWSVYKKGALQLSSGPPRDAVEEFGFESLASAVDDDRIAVEVVHERPFSKFDSLSSNQNSSGRSVDEEGISKLAVHESGFESLLGFPEDLPIVVGSEGRQGVKSSTDDTVLQMIEQMLISDNHEPEGLAWASESALIECPSRCPSRELKASCLNLNEESEDDEIGNLGIGNHNCDSFLEKSTCEGDVLLFSGCLDSMLSAEKSFTSVNGVDGVDWESVDSSSIHASRMETLDELVEKAQNDKEVLINSIEDIRTLRLKADQAEYAARQAKDEAARGGMDVLARVDEMRQMLARAREANAAHAGEVYGEKAVLATEARELRSRLVQVKAEKAKALSVLNEIKASIQARINHANYEREAAEHAKAAKEALAKDLLAKEEALLAKVAQESRNLDAEVEACTKLRECLIKHGSVVDALQGEVAVLCEDAEALKKDLDGMSLSCGGGYVHMLSRTGSDIYNSIGSRSGKLSDLNVHGLSSESLTKLEDGALSFESDLGSSTQGRVPGTHKVCEKRSWSPIPSLLLSLSGSQELSNGNHPVHTTTAAVNSTSSSKSGPRMLRNFVGESELASSELIEDTKYLSSPTSPGVIQLEKELYEAQMAMFPGEELQLQYSGSNNLDIFRSEKPHGSNSGTDDEDWHLLDPVRSSKGSSRSSWIE